jgi:hypothetical protein
MAALHGALLALLKEEPKTEAEDRFVALLAVRTV